MNNTIQSPDLPKSPWSPHKSRWCPIGPQTDQLRPPSQRPLPALGIRSSHHRCPPEQRWHQWEIFRIQQIGGTVLYFWPYFLGISPEIKAWKIGLIYGRHIDVVNFMAFWHWSIPIVAGDIIQKNKKPMESLSLCPVFILFINLYGAV